MGKGELLRGEIDHLASLFEYGALQAATSPAEFLARVSAEVVLLRNRLAAAEAKGRRGALEDVERVWNAIYYKDREVAPDEEFATMIAALKEKVKP
jgi:hypothetical protein